MFCATELMTQSTNILVSLTSSNHGALAMKILKAMCSAKATWGNFIRQTLQIGCTVTPPDRHANYAIHEAARSGLCSSIEEFITEDTVHIRNHDGDTPLHIAIEHNNFEDVKVLLGKIISLNLLNNNGWTPLHSAAAARCPSQEIANLLTNRMGRSNQMQLLNAETRR